MERKLIKMTKSVLKTVVAALSVTAIVLVALFGITYLDVPGVLEDDAISMGLDLVGGSLIVYEAQSEEGSSTLESDISAVLAIMRQRLDALGFTEATVTRIGDNKIQIEMPEITNPAEAIKQLGSTAKLEFRDYQGNVVMDGTGVSSATAVYGYLDNSQTSLGYFVSITLNDEGVKKFSAATERIATLSNSSDRYIAIYLDDELQSQPTVSEKITGKDIMISNPQGFESEDAKWLANVITAGQLPFDLKVIQANTIGPQLGEDALNTSLLAGAIGILLIMIFMSLIYKLPGLISSLALVVYIAIISIILAAFNINLSLPGIAGIILSIGMAVDANIIIFERIKEELAFGKSVVASVNNGFKSAFSAILDSNVTTLIASGVLWYFSTGSIQGFAVTLFIGVVVSLFTALLVTRYFLNICLSLNLKNPRLYGNSVKEEIK